MSRRTPATPAHAAPPARRAFTLLEVIVVLIIVAVLASLVVPRFGGNTLRLAVSEAGEVQRVLTIAAEKSLISGAPVAVAFEPKDNRFVLLIRVASEDQPQASGTPSRAAATAAQWRADPLVEPAVLTKTVLRSAAIDGRRLPPGSAWNAPFWPGQARPDIRLTFGPPDSSGSAIDVVLTPDAVGAIRTGAGVPPSRSGAMPLAIDLDDTGRGTKPW